MKIKQVLQEGLFLVVIFLSIMEILQIAPGDMKFFKEMLSWVLIGFFLYYLSPTKTLFNSKNKKMDLFILISLYFFAFKNLSHIIANGELNSLGFLRIFLFKYPILNEVTFQIGSVLIIILSIFLGMSVKYKENSLLGWIRGKREQRNLLAKGVDVFIIYFVLLSFSYFIFTIVMEWFALALDSYFVVIALAYYFIIFYIFKVKRNFRIFVSSVVETGEKFIKLFLNLFHNKNTILFGISGIIVIHAVVDIGNFIFPYLLNMKDTLYLTTLDPATHQTIMELFLKDFITDSLIRQISLGFIYIQNIIAIFFLLFLPFYLWLRMASKKKIRFKRVQIAIFFSSLVCFIFAPIFKIEALKSQTIIGADILTHSLQGQGNLHIIAFISILWFFIAYMLGSVESIKKWLERLVVFASIFFLGQYIYHFYSSSLLYYISNIKFLFTNSKILLAVYLLAYLMVITLFYIAGFILFVFEVMDSEHFSFIKLNLKIQKRIIFFWSLILFLGFIYLLNINKISELLVLMIASTILSIILFRYEKGPAKYILMVNLIIGAFLIIILASAFLDFRIELLDLINRGALLLIAIAIIVLFKFKINLGLRSWKKVLFAIILGIISGFWFFFLKEPKAPLLFSNLSYILFFSLLIAINEELIFRYLMLKVSSSVYSLNSSFIIQGLFFGLLHLINFNIFLKQFGPVMLLSLFISLVIFGILMGLLSIEKVKGKEKINPSYAIVCHAIAVLVLNLIP